MSGFDVEEPREDDFAGMLAALEERLDRGTIARAVGVHEDELDLIAVGHAPDPDQGKRLRMLYELARRTQGDLGDPATLLEAAGLATPEGQLLVPLSLLPRLKTFIVAFLVFDAILFAVVVLVFALR